MATPTGWRAAPRILAESRLEAAILRVLSYAAAVTAVIGIWWLAPEPWVAVGFAALGLTLIVLGSRTNIRDFIYQAHAAAVLAFLRVLAVNFGEPNPHLQVRVVTVALTAAMLYACARWSGLTRTSRRTICFLLAHLDRFAAGRDARLARTEAGECGAGLDAPGSGAV